MDEKDKFDGTEKIEEEEENVYIALFNSVLNVGVTIINYCLAHGLV